MEIEHVQPPDPPPPHLVLAEVPVIPADPLVAPRAEGIRTFPGQDDHPHVRIVARRGERVSQLEEGLGPEGIADLGPADGDLGDPLPHLVPDVVVATFGTERRG